MRLNFINEVLIALLFGVISTLGILALYFPQMLNGSESAKLIQLFEFISTGTLIDAYLLISIFLIGIIRIFLAITRYQLARLEQLTN